MRLVRFGLIVGLLAAGPAFAQAPRSAEATRTSSVAATVEAIDLRTRQIALRGEDGSIETIVVGRDVRRLDPEALRRSMARQTALHRRNHPNP